MTSENSLQLKTHTFLDYKEVIEELKSYNINYEVLYKKVKKSLLQRKMLKIIFEGALYKPCYVYRNADKYRYKLMGLCLQRYNDLDAFIDSKKMSENNFYTENVNILDFYRKSLLNKDVNVSNDNTLMLINILYEETTAYGEIKSVCIEGLKELFEIAVEISKDFLKRRMQEDKMLLTYLHKAGFTHFLPE